MNGFLKTRAELSECTEYLKQNGIIEHGLSCKNFDLRHIVPQLGNGNLLDLGASGSWILENAEKKRLKGRKVGIDLSYTFNSIMLDGIELVKGDLMHTPFYDGTFCYITCLSVIEHEVNFELLAKECARLLTPKGKLFITFDFWNPKVSTEGLTLYGLKWDILDKEDVLRLVDACKKEGLELTSEIDWIIQDAVINDKFCSPFAGISYTFGLLEMVKI